MQKITHFLSPKVDSRCFDIQYEWEDIICMELGIKHKTLLPITKWIYRQIDLRLHLTDVYQILNPKNKSMALYFEMVAKTKPFSLLSKNVIPIIIDFWLSKDELPAFYNAYKHVPLMLISSKEVFQFLVENNCPITIEHWGLSLPDNLKLNENITYNKIWDLVIIGRPNPHFMRMLDRYSIENPSFVYVTSVGGTNDRKFVTNKGEFVCDGLDRENYLKMIQESKIGLYTTPGIDEGKQGANGFNQVTPRLMEMLAGGQHVIAHYTDNPDTRYYKLNSISPDVTNYEQFKLLMDKYRKEPAPIIRNAEYLKEHYTSVRAKELKRILVKYGYSI